MPFRRNSTSESPISATERKGFVFVRNNRNISPSPIVAAVRFFMANNGKRARNISWIHWNKLEMLNSLTAQINSKILENQTLEVSIRTLNWIQNFICEPKWCSSLNCFSLTQQRKVVIRRVWTETNSRTTIYETLRRDASAVEIKTIGTAFSALFGEATLEKRLSRGFASSTSLPVSELWWLLCIIYDYCSVLLWKLNISTCAWCMCVCDSTSFRPLKH